MCILPIKRMRLSMSYSGNSFFHRCRILAQNWQAMSYAQTRRFTFSVPCNAPLRARSAFTNLGNDKAHYMQLKNRCSSYLSPFCKFTTQSGRTMSCRQSTVITPVEDWFLYRFVSHCSVTLKCLQSPYYDQLKFSPRGYSLRNYCTLIGSPLNFSMWFRTISSRRK